MDRLFSRLPGAWRVGADYFARHRLLAPEEAPEGLVDRISDLGGPDLETEVPPAVQQFFTGTAELELLIVPSWNRWFSPLLAVLFWWLTRIGQFVQPRRRATIHTRLLALDQDKDGRRNSRGVIRTYADTGAPMQVVAYAVAGTGDQALMSATFPLPLGALTGLLRLEVEGNETRLTSRRRSVTGSGKKDRSGVWWHRGWLRLRLPLQETMTFWAAEADEASELEGTTLRCRHRQWLFGIPLVSYQYYFRPLTGRDQGPGEESPASISSSSARVSQ